MFEKTKEILPQVQRAEEIYYGKLENVRTETDYAEIVKEFNTVLEMAIDAIAEDTKGSRQALEEHFKATGKLNTHFGVNPTNIIKEFIHDGGHEHSRMENLH